MPRIWLDYCALLAKLKRTTIVRRTYDRALQALPITQVAEMAELSEGMGLQDRRGCVRATSVATVVLQTRAAPVWSSLSSLGRAWVRAEGSVAHSPRVWWCAKGLETGRRSGEFARHSRGKSLLAAVLVLA